MKDGGGGGTYDGMEGRVSSLETHMTYIRKDLDGISRQLEVLATLPTKRDLESWRIEWLAVGVGIVALVVGGVVGGLALINHYAAAGPVSPAPAPIVLMVPTPQAVAPPKAK